MTTLNHMELFRKAIKEVRKDSPLWLCLESEIKLNKVNKEDCKFMVEQMLEYINMPADKFAILFEYCEESIKKDPNIFKWACGTCSLEVVKYLYDKVEIEPLGVIQAAINTLRTDIIKFLESKDLPVFKEMFLDRIFIRSLYRSHLESQKFKLINYYLENIEKVDDLSSYFLERLNNQIKTKPLGYINDNNEDVLQKLKKNVEIILNKKDLEKKLGLEKSKPNNIPNKI